MRIVSLSYIGDEEDIIEAFIRWHADWVDRMIVVCTAEEQATPAILQRLRREGYPIELTFHRPTFHDQGPVLTRVLHEASARYAPDWFVPLDADEFVSVPGDPRKAIATLPRNRVTLVPWRTYAPTAKDAAAEAVAWKRILHRRTPTDHELSKVIIPAALLTPDAALVIGSHALIGPHGPYPSIPASQITLAHFPVRSAAQLMRKVRRGHRAMQANPHRRPDECFHWAELFARFASDERIDLNDLTEIALGYSSREKGHTLVLDPLTPPILRKWRRVRAALGCHMRRLIALRE